MAAYKTLRRFCARSYNQLPLYNIELLGFIIPGSWKFRFDEMTAITPGTSKFWIFGPTGVIAVISLKYELFLFKQGFMLFFKLWNELPLVKRTLHFCMILFKSLVYFKIFKKNTKNILINPLRNLRSTLDVFHVISKNETVLGGKIFSLVHLNSSNFTLFSMKRVSRFHIICVGVLLRVFHGHFERL